MCAAEWCAEGSPSACTLEWIDLMGSYSAPMLVQIRTGIPTKKMTDANSCPLGWKIWSPQTKTNVTTVLGSTVGWSDDSGVIVDVTRKADGCGGCREHAMRSGVAEQSSWGTLDGTPWWLRDEEYEQPDDD